MGTGYYITGKIIEAKWISNIALGWWIGAIVLFFVGSASQEAYDFVQSEQGANLAPLVKKAATAFYYILPNFSAFDLKVNAIYGVPLSPSGLLFTAAYFFVYTALVLTVSVMSFTTRELK